MVHRALVNASQWDLFRRVIGFALAWSLALGTATMPGVWAATYHVNGATGSDANTPAQAQNPATPWKTLTRAVSEVTLTVGDDIQVAAGTYDPALGEAFPLTLVDGVAIIGDPADPNSRVIDPPPGTHAFSNDNTPLAADTTLAGFRITHDTGLSGDAVMEFVVESVAMAPQIRNNVFIGNPNLQIDGILINDNFDQTRSFTGLISDNIFEDLGQTVTILLDYNGRPADFSPTIRGNTFTDCTNPVDILVASSFSGTVSPVISNNTATESTFDVEIEISLSGGRGPTVAPLISNNTFSGQSLEGISASIGFISLASPTDTLTFSPTVLNNTISNTGSAGMFFYFEELEVGKFASDMTIAGNTITNPGSEGIYFKLTYFSDGESMNIDWVISNNSITFGAAGASQGIEVAADDYLNYLEGDLTLTVAGNTITGARDGIDISVTELTSTEIDLAVTIQGNTITSGEYDGIWFRAYSQTMFTNSDVDILDNVIDGNGSDGLVIETDDSPSPTSYVEVACNTIVNNGGHGVILNPYSGCDISPDFGGGDIPSPGLNTLMSNGTVSGYDFFNNCSLSVSALYNWWGSTDSATIESHIWDNDDDPTKGVVQYAGFLSAAPTVSATATLVDALEVDLSPTGPSEGDTIRYTATLEGTGDCGCASAVFTAGMPDNGTFIPDSLTASHGILINESVGPDHPELIVGLGALEAGETVTITWDVMAGSGCSMTSQATLSCFQLGDVLTDDPDVGGDSDPTTILFVGCDIFADGFESGDTTAWSITVG